MFDADERLDDMKYEVEKRKLIEEDKLDEQHLVYDDRNYISINEDMQIYPIYKVSNKTGDKLEEYIVIYEDNKFKNLFKLKYTFEFLDKVIKRILSLYFDKQAKNYSGSPKDLVLDIEEEKT